VDIEDEAVARPSSWPAALSQLPGFLAEHRATNLPKPAGTARAVTSEIEEDLANKEEPEPAC
jgi:hypothetical protein